jgi:hypothetical protein
MGRPVKAGIETRLTRKPYNSDCFYIQPDLVSCEKMCCTMGKKDQAVWILDSAHQPTLASYDIWIQADVWRELT